MSLIGLYLVLIIGDLMTVSLCCNNQIKKFENHKQKRADVQTTQQTEINGIQVQTLNDGTILCDGFVCPPNTKRCIVDRKLAQNPKFVQRIRQCSNENDHIIDSITTIETNLMNPNLDVNYHVEHSINGSDIIVSGDLKELFPKDSQNDVIYVG